MAATNTEINNAVGQRLLWGWWLLPLFQAMLIALLGLPHSAEGWQLQCLNLTTGLLCAYGLSRDHRSYSLNQVFWVFTFVFMALMPALFYSRGFMPHGLVPVALMQKASGIVLGCALLYMLVQFALHYYFKEKTIPAPTPFHTIDAGRFRRLAPWLMAACTLAVVWILGPQDLWLQAQTARAWEESIPNNVVRLLVQYGLRGVMLYLCVAGAFLYRQKKLKGSLLTLLLGLALIANFPFSMSRYLMGAFYLAIFLSLLPQTVWKRSVFALLLLSAILLAAPLLNFSRLKNFTLDKGDERNFSFLVRASYGADYDAYAMLCRTVQYTGEKGPTQGRQLAGVLLFFCPRQLWSEKPVGTGSRVYESLHLGRDDWHNVSAPLLAEGYVNFSWPGSLLFTALLSVIIFFYDRGYWWRRVQSNMGESYLFLFYPASLGLLLLWLRGDMMSAFAYSMGLYVSGYVMHWALSRKKRQYS